MLPFDYLYAAKLFLDHVITEMKKLYVKNTIKLRSNISKRQ